MIDRKNLSEPVRKALDLYIKQEAERRAQRWLRFILWGDPDKKPDA
jgi:hypothetical protein